MCIIMKDDLDKMFVAVKDYVTNYNGESLVDDLKDHLADLKEQEKLSYCGCDGLFVIKKIDEATVVFIELVSRIYKFIIDGDKSICTGSCHSEACPELYEIPEWYVNEEI